MVSKKIINVGILAHADAGKTTITEQLLYLGGSLRSFGSVDKGTAQTDGLKIEQERGISVRAASAVIELEGTVINIIDTPGHSDFLSEVERALSVLDYGIIVISAAEGIQAQTEVLIEAAKEMKLPLLVFINKIDRAGSNSSWVFEELKKLLPAVQINLPLDEGRENPRVCDAPQEELVLTLEDDGLMDRLIEGLPLKGLWEKAGEAVKNLEVVPVLYGSSKLGLGVDKLLWAIENLCSEVVGGEELCGRVFKVDFDAVLGKGAHVRLFSGELQNRQSIYNQRTQREEKSTAIRRVFGRKIQDISLVERNQVAIVYGLSEVRAGDIIGKGICPGNPPKMAQSLLSVKVEPNSQDELNTLLKALNELCDEDPMLDMRWIKEKREISLRISGKIQIEILEANLLDRYGLKVKISTPSVIYKETPIIDGEGFDAYTMPKPCWAVLKFKIEPMPRGSGLSYESTVPNKNLLYRYQNHVETAVPKALEQGLYGWEVVDLKVTLIYGEHHLIHTHPLDFFLCTPLAIMNGLQNTGTYLLEPYYRVRFWAAEEHLGKTIGTVLDRRGSFDTPIMENGRFGLVSLIPVAECMELQTDFAALTGGRGTLGYSFSHYDLCPEGFIAKRERIGVNPLDRSKFILEQRNAIN